MRLRSPVLERAVRVQALSDLRKSPFLWREYRQHRTRWWGRNRNLRATLSAVFIFAVLFLAVVRSGRALALLAVIALYGSGTAIFRCANYYARVLRGYDRAVLITLPVLDNDYLRHESRGLLRSWAGAFAIFALAYGTYSAVYGDLRRDLAASLVAATLQTLSSLCLGCAVLAYRPKWTGVKVIIPVAYGLMAVCLFLPEDGLQFLWSAVLITPAGWVAHGFAGMVGGADSAERFWLLPSFVIAASLPFALRWLRSRLLSELAIPGDVFETISAPDSGEAEQQAPSTESTASAETLPDVNLVLLFEGTDWTRLGWIERLVAAWLTQRQRVIAEFMMADDLGSWTKNWRTAAMITGVGTALTLAAPSLPPWLFFLPMVFAGFLSAPMLAGSWVGFKGPFTSGFILPAYACFPLGYGEISRVMLKTNVIRALTWAPLALVYAAALAHRHGFSFYYGSVVGRDIVLIVLALQPVMVAGHFSSGTNDTRQINWQTLLFFSGALLILIITLIAAFMMFIVPTDLVQAIAITTIFMMSLATWAGYKLLYERGRIDLLSRPGAR